MDDFTRFIKTDTPFLFIFDYENREPIIMPLRDAEEKGIYYDFGGKTNFRGKTEKKPSGVIIEKNPVTYNEYLKAFSIVRGNLEDGNSYLTNLTFKTPLEINLTLEEIFGLSRAKYKLLYKDWFVVFSPETFIRIENNRIYTYPMKGTIDASLPDAAKMIINDEKETAEHITVVDLLRNDLNMISKNVRVDKFRYIEKIRTNFRDLLQVSSAISGELDREYPEKLRGMLKKILPAGSVTGAPKKKTVEIIEQAENYKRGYYTGIFGYYEKGVLESAVMIRFIEQENGEYYYKSGGGITIYSNPEKEYRELIDKIYVPVY